MTFSFRCVTILSKACKNIWSWSTSAPPRKNSYFNRCNFDLSKTSHPFRGFPEGTPVRCHKPYRWLYHLFKVQRKSFSCPKMSQIEKYAEISFGYPTSAERCICIVWTNRFKSLILSIHYTCPISRVYSVFVFKIFRICDIEEALALSLKLAAA